MSLKKQIEQDVDSFFKDIDKMLPEGKKKALMLLFEKYCHISSADTLFNKQDFNRIKEHAITLYKDQAFPKKFNNSYSEISGQEAPNFCLVQAVIDYLHSKDCLKKTPRFDIKPND